MTYYSNQNSMYQSNSSQRNQEGTLWSGGENIILNKFNSDAPLSENLLGAFENEIFRLKQEADELYPYMSKNRTTVGSYSNSFLKDASIDFDEEKVHNQYLAYNPSRVQAIKHVATNYKPEYLTLDEIRKQREEHSRILEKSETEYYDYLHGKNSYAELKPKRKATREKIKKTIPNPPSVYYNKGKKDSKINEILEQRRKEEEEIYKKFKANDLNREIFDSQFENIIVQEKTLRMERCEKIKGEIIKNMKPFSFYDIDEQKYKEKLVKECQPPEFLPFKANPIPWTSQVNLYEDMLTKKAIERNQRVEERARQNLLSAKLPARMEMHEKRKKLQEEEMKSMERSEVLNRSKSFKANRVPNFTKAYESFMNEMEKKKSIAKRTEPKPFTFHEPKVSFNINF